MHQSVVIIIADSALLAPSLMKVCYGPGDLSLRAAVNHFMTHSDYVPIDQHVSLLTCLEKHLTR